MTEFKIGDLVYATERMRNFGYSEPAIIIKRYGGRYVLAFPDGSTQVFHPNHLKPDKK